MNQHALLDPWLDAAHIASRLQAEGAELVVVLGAQAWCSRCRVLHPAFVAAAPPLARLEQTWLWLDLEDHNEFIGSFIPDDLPLFIRYAAGALVEAGVLLSVEPGGWQLRAVSPASDWPSLWQVLMVPNWATEKPDPLPPLPST